MSIEETNQVDIIATRPDSNVVRLIMTDHLDWDDPQSHLELLQAKINSYIAFVESGQLERTKQPRIPEAPEVIVEVVFSEPPSPLADPLLSGAREVLAEINIVLVTRMRAQEGPDD